MDTYTSQCLGANFLEMFLKQKILKRIVIQSIFVIIVKLMCIDCKIADFKISILDFSEDLYACSTILTANFCS